MSCSIFEKAADDLALSEKTKRQFLVVADEIFTNIASYSGAKEVTVEICTSEQGLSLTFSDSGVPFNPLEVPPPDLSVPLAERKIGGLGIFMVRKIMDGVEYRREDGKNILVVTKHDI